MHATQRLRPAGVIERLYRQPHGFEFFQAVRRLEQWFVREEGLQREDVLARRIAFRNSLSLAFPASEIEKFEPEPDDAQGSGRGPATPPSPCPRRVSITPAFIGLLGPGGPLPAFYTQECAQREAHGRSDATRAFLDVFLQRIVVLLYEAWRKHRLPVRYETDPRGEFLPLVLSLAGLGQDALRDRMRAAEGGVRDATVAYYAGLVQKRPLSAAALQQILSDHFRVRVAVTQFVGQWFTLSAAHQSALGLRNCGLAGSAIAGERVWQRSLRVRLALGPMSFAVFGRFLPGREGHVALVELVTLLTGVAVDYDVRLSLKAADVRGVTLDMASTPRLGWNTFLLTAPAHRDRDDPGYRLHPAA
jgi:type VI secretion system protein ImpH